MYMTFDAKNLHVQLIVGTKETYTPSTEVLQIQTLVDDLRVELTKIQDEIIGPKLQVIQKLIESFNNSQQQPATPTANP